MSSMALTTSEKEAAGFFRNLKNRRDVARLLDVPYSQLFYNVYKRSKFERYREFLIPKKSGGVRKISQPTGGLYCIQSKLREILEEVYRPRSCVHGFVKNKSIVSNAEKHLNKKYVFNIDLEDFFSSIHFGRVRGMFLGCPHFLNNEVATFLAQICCHEYLPQGAPTSPIISNMICAKMDSELQRLARKHFCTYSRFADDITFSTYKQIFPPEIAQVSPSGNSLLGKKLTEIIESNGFKINVNKVRLQGRKQRQEVTGLTVNRKLNVNRKYVRQIRAMLYSWGKFGFESAQAEFWNKYDRKHRSPENDQPDFKKVVKGKIDFLRMIKGPDDPVYRKLLSKYSQLDDAFDFISPIDHDESSAGGGAQIFTEGKTDILHLQAALSKLKELDEFNELQIHFPKERDKKFWGDDGLKKLCHAYRSTSHREKMIFLFDRDVEFIVSEFGEQDENPFREWGNNVFSFVLPIPEHRSETNSTSIEHLYKDCDLHRVDSNGRRIFLSNEFNRETSLDTSKKYICRMPSELGKGMSIVEKPVVRISDEMNVTLSKNDFAENIYFAKDGFEGVDFSAFREIFRIVNSIINVK